MLMQPISPRCNLLAAVSYCLLSSRAGLQDYGRFLAEVQDVGVDRRAGQMLVTQGFLDPFSFQQMDGALFQKPNALPDRAPPEKVSESLVRRRLCQKWAGSYASPR